MIKGTFWLHYFFDTVFRFLHMTSFVSCLTWSEEHFDEILFDTMSRFYLRHHLSRQFAIFPSFFNFIAFWSIFTWILQNVCRGWSCLTWLEEHSSNIIFLMLSLFFYLWHHLWRQFAIFPSFYNYIAFWPLELDF